MELFLTLALFFIGFFVLVKGAQVLVHGAVNVANVFNVSTWFIGAVVVSIGTSVPELSINLAAVFSGNDVGLATIIGSNIFNVLLALGVMSFAAPVIMRRDWVFSDLSVFVAITLFGSALILFPVLGDKDFYGVTQAEAIALLAVFAVWIGNMIRTWDDRHENLDFEVVTVFTAIVMVIGGLIGVFVGGNWVVDGAVQIATIFGVSPATIGLTVVALGTSLPELVVSMTALSKGSLGIAVGNILGSSVFNLLGVLGVTGVIAGLPIQEETIVLDVGFMVGAAVLWFIFMFTGKKYTLARVEGIAFIGVYALFLILLLIR